MIYTTHVGSLPFKSVDQALEFSFKFTMPALFSLPQRDSRELMGYDFLSLVGGKEKLGKQTYIRPFHLDKFLQQLEKEKTQQFKVQMIGPVSLRKFFCQDFKQAELSQILLSYYSELFNYLENWGEPFLVLDEPGLKTKMDIASLNQFLGAIDNTNSWGVHCCQKIELKIFEGLIIQYKQLDWSLYQQSELPSLSEHRFIGGMEKLSAGTLGSLSFPQDNYIISPACGLAMSEDITKVFNSLNTAKEFIAMKSTH